MIARFLPMKGSFIAGPYPNGKVFAQTLESKPLLDTYSVYAVNIGFTFSGLPCTLINVDASYKSLTQSITALEGSNILTTQANVFLAEQKIQLEKQLAFAEGQAFYWKFVEEKNLGEGATERELRAQAQAGKEVQFGVIAAIKTTQMTVENNLAAIESNRHSIKALERERNELGQREAAEMLHNFQPLNVTARLLRNKEILWSGNIIPDVIPSGAMINEIAQIKGKQYRICTYEITYFTAELRQQFAPGELTGGDFPLELELIVTGPTEWEIGSEKSGVGMFPTKGTKGEGNRFAFTGKNAAEEKEKQVEKSEQANVIVVESCNLQISYDHEP
jgi:hypothetical protein